MKLVSASLFYLAFGGAIALGIILLTAGKPALLIGATLVYLAMLGKIGCAAH